MYTRRADTERSLGESIPTRGNKPRLFYNGQVTLLMPPVLQFSCGMDLRVYPFDSQECRIILFCLSSVLVFGQAQGDPLLSRSILAGDYSISGEWAIVSVEGENKDWHFFNDMYVECRLITMIE